MGTQSYTFRFPKHCNQDVMLRMIVMLIAATQIDVSVFPGSYAVSEEEMMLFNTQHPDFVVPYMEILTYCQTIGIHHTAVLANISIISATGVGVILLNLTPKTTVIEIGVF